MKTLQAVVAASALALALFVVIDTRRERTALQEELAAVTAKGDSLENVARGQQLVVLELEQQLAEQRAKNDTLAARLAPAIHILQTHANRIPVADRAELRRILLGAE